MSESYDEWSRRVYTGTQFEHILEETNIMRAKRKSKHAFVLSKRNVGITIRRVLRVFGYKI